MKSSLTQCHNVFAFISRTALWKLPAATPVESLPAKAALRRCPQPPRNKLEALSVPGPWIRVGTSVCHSPNVALESKLFGWPFQREAFQAKVSLRGFSARRKLSGYLQKVMVFIRLSSSKSLALLYLRPLRGPLHR